MKKTLFYLPLIFVITFYGCKSELEMKNLNTKNKFVFEAIDSEQDSIFVAGETFKLKLYCNESYKIKFIENKEPVFVIFTFFCYDSTAPIIITKKLKPSNDKEYLFADFHISNSSSYFSANVFDNNFNHDFNYYYYPVFRKEKDGYILTENAVCSLIRYDTTGINYKDFIKWENEYYPENGLIYISKWLYEIEHKILEKKSIISDLKAIISKDNISLEQKNILSYVAHTLLNNNDSAYHYLLQIADIRNSAIFNREDVSNALNLLYNISSNISREDYSFALSKILMNNPNTYFAKRQIDRSTMYNLPKDVVNSVLNSRIASGNYDFVDLLKYADNLIFSYKYNNRKLDLTSNYKDSIIKAKIILDSLEYYYNQPYTAKLISMNSHSLRNKRQILYTCILGAYMMNDDFSGLIQKAMKILSTLETLDDLHSSIYYEIGRAYSHLKEADSSDYYFSLSLSLNPNNEFVRSQFITELKKRYHSKNVDSILDSLLSIFKLPQYKLSENTPHIITVEGKKISMLKNIKPIMIEFFTTYCKPCQSNIEFIIKNSSIREKVDIYLISPEKQIVVEEYFKQKGINLKYILNGNEIIRFFNITSFPETIIISEQGILMKRFTGIYNDEFADSFK